MKLCEYMNNFFSLEMLTKQSLKGKITETVFLKYVYSKDHTIFKRLLHTNLKFRVEKEAHEPLYKILGEHIENEEIINKYIKKFGILPIVLEIYYSFDDGSFVEEAFYPYLFSEKFKYYEEKYIYLEYR